MAEQTRPSRRADILYPPDDSCILAYLCDKYGSDKGELTSDNNPYPWRSHTYTDIYALLFGHCRKHIRNVLECGIGTNNPHLQSSMGVHGKPGASLRVWRDYFPNAEIIGIDIDPDILFTETRIRTFQADQTSPDSIRQFWEAAGVSGLDVIIDDGLHKFHAGVCLFEHSIDKLAKEGVYVIEDITREDMVRYTTYFNEKSARYHYLSFALGNAGKETHDNNMLVIKKKSALSRERGD